MSSIGCPNGGRTNYYWPAKLDQFSYIPGVYIMQNAMVVGGRGKWPLGKNPNKDLREKYKGKEK